MPPTFLYILASMIWVCLACMVWLTAGCLCILPQTRSFAKSISVAMLGTFPGVFLFQLVAAPIAVAILVVGGLVGRLIEPGNSTTTEHPFVIGTSVAVILIDFTIVAGMSLLGCCEGWRAGWQISKGLSWRNAIEGGASARVFRSLQHRLDGHATTRTTPTER